MEPLPKIRMITNIENVKPQILFQEFNERLGVFHVTRRTFDTWRLCRGKVDSKSLKFAMQVYDPGDWRHEFAKKLLDGSAVIGTDLAK